MLSRESTAVGIVGLVAILIATSVGLSKLPSASRFRKSAESGDTRSAMKLAESGDRNVWNEVVRIVEKGDGRESIIAMFCVPIFFEKNPMLEREAVRLAIQAAKQEENIRLRIEAMAVLRQLRCVNGGVIDAIDAALSSGNDDLVLEALICLTEFAASLDQKEASGLMDDVKRLRFSKTLSIQQLANALKLENSP
ncbi:MAG: hypothetical protein ACI814_003447 [Mariniblastus sp.]|jgi:hypothetical protein